MTAQQRPPLKLVPPSGPDTDRGGENAPITPPPVLPKKVGVMEWLERRSQPYIVIATSIAAVIRGFYLFTDKLINLTHIPLLNIPLSVGTGIIMSIVSELTISIAGRRHKLYKAQLYAAKMSLATANKQQKEVWKVEVERLGEQVKGNLLAMRVSMGMSLVAAASYLIDSTGAAGFIQFATASALAGYVLYMMYYHGVQTDEIKDDGAIETEERIIHELNLMRVEEVGRLAVDLRSQGTLSVPARLALIASGLRAPAQRQVMPTVRLLLNQPTTNDDELDTANWYTIRDIALMLGKDLVGKSSRDIDNICRNYRRKASDHAHQFPDRVRLDPVRGWVVEPDYAADLYDLPDGVITVNGNLVVDADPSENE